MSQPIDPRLAERAKAYYEELKTSYAAGSHSHVTLHRLHAEFGEKAVAAALEPYFQAERDEAALRNWATVQKFYKEAGVEPAADHPEKLAAEKVLAKRRAAAADNNGPGL